jgi:hypothetical protein
MATLSPFAQARRKSEYFLKALEFQNPRNLPPEIKGQVVTSDESAYPLGKGKHLETFFFDLLTMWTQWVRIEHINNP